MQTATFEVFCYRVVCEGFAQHLIVYKAYGAEGVGQQRLNLGIFVDGEERAQVEHRAFQVTLVVGEGRAGIQRVQTQLQQVVVAYFAHRVLAARYLVELLGIVKVLFGDAHILLCQQQIEEIVYRAHGNLFRSSKEFGFCLGVTYGLYASVPLCIVHAKDWLVKCEGNGGAHVTTLLVAAEGFQIVERRVERQCAACEPYTLLHRQLAVHLHVVVAHKGVCSVAVLIAVVTLAVTRRCCLEIYFGQQSCAVDAVLPIGRAQLVQGYGCVEALRASEEYCLLECQVAYIPVCVQDGCHKEYQNGCYALFHFIYCFLLINSKNRAKLLLY